MNRQFLSLPILLILSFIGGGCNNSTSPVIVAKVIPYKGPGEFHYVLNGRSYDRPLSGSSAMATIDSNWGLGVPPNSNFLAINLYYALFGAGSLHQTTIELYLPFITPLPGTYPIVKWDDPTQANAALLVDSLQYNGLAGGFLTITKFDTVNNLVSGSFRYTAALASRSSTANLIDTVTGSFTDVGIYIGAYNQGTISADIDGFAYSTVSSSQHTLSAWTEGGSDIFTIEAFDDDNLVQRELYFSIANLDRGVFNISTSTIYTNTANYSTSGAPTDVSINTQSGATGQLTITRYDTAARRISGTFYLNGVDAKSGKTVHVANGVIDNVQWSVL